MSRRRSHLVNGTERVVLRWSVGVGVGVGGVNESTPPLSLTWGLKSSAKILEYSRANL